MKILETTEDDATVIISFDELAFLHQGMREALEALNDREMRARTGKTREQAEALMSEIERVGDAINNHE
jgi:hypothetical protein